MDFGSKIIFTTISVRSAGKEKIEHYENLKFNICKFYLENFEETNQCDKISNNNNDKKNKNSYY